MDNCAVVGSIGLHARATWTDLGLALAFMLTRLLAVLVLPGFVLYRLAQVLFAWHGSRMAPDPPDQPPQPSDPR